MCPKRFFNFKNRADLNRPLDMTTSRSCSWCDITLSDISTINIPDSEQINKFLCSEKCFEASRRASFKRTKICDWCDKTSVTDTGVKSGSEYSSTSRASFKSDSIEVNENSSVPTIDHLQFCNSSCLSNYKQTYFVKETSEVLQVKKEKTITPIQSLEPKNNQKSSIINNPSKLPIFPKNHIVSNRITKPLYKSPKLVRSTTIPKFQKTTKRNNSSTPTLVQKMNNLCHLPLNPIFNPLNVFSEFVNSCPNSSLPNFNIPLPPPPENVKVPSTGPIYIPIPIPIPIPIFKNAPEILEILHNYGYKQSKPLSNENINPKSSPSLTTKTTKILPSAIIEPQTEALDLSGSSDSLPENILSSAPMNIVASFPLASILQLNDPYLKRRNRILDAPPSSVSGINNHHQMSTVKNFSLNYTELLTSTQLKSGKYSKRKFERSGTVQKIPSHQSQTPKQIVHTAKSLLRRYPLISLRRNIKSAPSSVLDSSNKMKNISD